MIKDILKLCLVTHRHLQPSTYKKFILKAVEGGVTSVQFRDKSNNLNLVRRIASELKEILYAYKIPLIINDYVEIAKEIDAEGIHLGQSDLSPIVARKLLGNDKIIGWSIESLGELELANQLSCLDYIAASSVFPSITKSNCKTIWGLDGLQKIVKKSLHPVIAIGGINLQNIQKIIDCGVSGVAVVSAIHHDKNPKKAASALIAKINLAMERKYV